MNSVQAWAEYDSAADWCAARGLSGDYESPLPMNLSSACLAMINDDVEAP